MDSSKLARRVEILEDIEAIKRTKARYWNAVDKKDWEVLASCLTPDFIFESPLFGRMEGREFVIKVLKRAMKTTATAHQGHNPEIEIKSQTSASGRWALNDQVRQAEGRLSAGYGHYDEEYEKLEGSWKIKTSKLSYVFQDHISKPGSLNN